MLDVSITHTTMHFVVSIRVGDYNTHQFLVDNGSSADILYYLAFQQMRIGKE